MRKIIYGLLMILLAVSAASYALSVPYLQSEVTGRRAAQDSIKAQPDVVVEDDTIPDSLLHPRWKIQRTSRVSDVVLVSFRAELWFPEIIKEEVVYNDKINRY